MKYLAIIVLTFFFSTVHADYVSQALSSINSMGSNYIEYSGYKNHFYSVKSGQKEAVVIVTGVAEPVLKYWQLTNELKDKYDVYLWDHINQGKSMKIKKDIMYKKVFIDKFSTYQETFNNFLKEVKPNYNKVNVISHSMGSHIMLRQLLADNLSIDRLVLVTPMIEVKKYFIPDWLAKFVLKTFFKPTDWAPSQGEKNVDASYLTRSRENFENYMKLLNEHYPKQISTGVTAGWLLKSLGSIDYVLKSDFSKINTPMLMLTGGDDSIIKSDKATQFCNKMANCKSHQYEKGKHQLFLEMDDIRLDVYERIKAFLIN